MDKQIRKSVKFYVFFFFVSLHLFEKVCVQEAEMKSKIVLLLLLEFYTIYCINVSADIVHVNSLLQHKEYNFYEFFFFLSLPCKV